MNRVQVFVKIWESWIWNSLILFFSPLFLQLLLYCNYNIAISEFKITTKLYFINSLNLSLNYHIDLNFLLKTYYLFLKLQFFLNYIYIYIDYIWIFFLLDYRKYLKNCGNWLMFYIFPKFYNVLNFGLLVKKIR